MSAVEFLKQNLPSLFQDDSGHYKKLFEQAKQMELHFPEISDEKILYAAEKVLEITEGDINYGTELFAFLEGAKWYKKQLRQ